LSFTTKTSERCPLSEEESSSVCTPECRLDVSSVSVPLSIIYFYNAQDNENSHAKRCLETVFEDNRKTKIYPITNYRVSE